MEALRVIKSVMKCLKLTLHPDKTKVVRPDTEGFDFLGLHFRKLRSRRKGKLAPYCWPSHKAMKSARCLIRDIISRRHLGTPSKILIRKLNPVIRGWRNYFRVGNSSAKLRQLDSYVRYRLWIRERARKGSRGRLRVDDFKRWVEGRDLERFYVKGICVNTQKATQLSMPFYRNWYTWRYWLG
jgi:hypothetical protein